MSGNFVEKEFIRNFLHSLCLKNVTSLHLGHDPWLKGLREVTKYLEDKTKFFTGKELECRIYRNLFHTGITGLYGALNAILSVSADVKLNFVADNGGTILDFPAYKHADWRQSYVHGVVGLADELAEVFAKAYFGG